MPSFDVVSELNMHEVTNAVDQANREVGSRFDFKDSNANYKLKDDKLVLLQATNDFQLKQMMDILHTKLSKRNIDIMCLEVKDPEIAGKEARQEVVLRQGIDTNLAKKIVQLIKDAKLKVQTSIQGDKVRVTGKKRDDLQTVIGFLRETKLNMPLQFNNFRD